MTTNNQNKSARSYQPQFKALLQAVFQKQSYFSDFFGGGIEALDGVQNNETAFSVKTSDIPVVVGAGYSKDKDVAFGPGTSNSNRFGDRTEVIYSDTPVDYTWGWNFHEGIDRYTVNNDLDSAIADRLDLQSQAKVQKFNVKHSEFIANSAGHSESLPAYDATNVLDMFNKLAKYFTNIAAVGTKVANVNTDLYNAIVDHPLTTTGKLSSTNIDENNVVKFKGFVIKEVPDELMTDGTDVFAALVYIQGVGKAFTGINTARSFESESFDGQALQGAGKAGEFILEDNKKAVVKVVLAK